MLSITQFKAGSAASAIEGYLSGGLLPENRGAEDYYTEGGQAEAQFLGSGAAALGLHQYDRQAFEHLLQGRDPNTGERLGQLGGERHRPGWDLTFSAPKSVSVAWALDDTRRAAIAQAHQQAVARALRYIEQHAAFCRRGKAGAEQEPARLVAAAFQHGTSRAGDMDLHTHTFVLNAAQRPDGTWGALEPRHMFEWKMAAGAIYRSELARAMQELGYAVERDDTSFRLAAVPQDLAQRFSKRREEIEAALAERGLNSAAAADVAALATRQAKEQTTRTELYEAWRAETREAGHDPDQAAQWAGRAPALRLAMPSTGDLLARLTEQASTFALKDVHRLLATEAQGVLSADEIEAKCHELVQSREIVRLEAADGSTRYSTREMIQLERQMAAAALARKDEARHPVNVAAMQQARAARTMSAEQDAAFAHIVGGRDGVTCVQGTAGAGKSYLLGAAREAWHAAGYEVRGAAPSGKAARGLQDSAGIRSQTLHSLLHGLREGRDQLTARTVIVIDEAGMVGSRMTAELLQRAQEAGAKVVLVGDARQLQPIDAGGAFRALTQRLGFAELREIRRQKEAWAQQAVHDFADGRAAQALAAYAQRGLLRISNDREAAMRELLSDWWHERDPAKPGESLMLAATRREVRHLNEMARTELQAAGVLGPGVEVQTSGGKLSIAAGDRLLFTRNSKLLSVQNGTLATVQQIERRGDDVRLIARTDDGQVVTWNVSEYQHFSHGYAITTHKAQGATVDRAYVLGGGTMADREMSYVQMSRHRELARMYLDREDIEAAMEAAPPSERMADYAQDLGAPAEALESWTACRRWLDEHSPAALGGADEREAQALLTEVADAVQAMARSRQKETTLDYQSVEIVPETETDAEIATPVPVYEHEYEDELEL